MATTAYGAMSFSQATNQCIDPAEMDNFIDFNAMPSPSPANASRVSSSQIPSAMTSPTSTIVPLDMGDDYQTPVAPSHEYQRFKQQTGLPSGSMASLRSNGESSQSSMFAGYNSGMDDFNVGSSMYDGMGSNSGLPDFGFDTESTSPLPAFFFPSGEGSQADDFVDPTAITRQEEAQANVRFYPGMHQQQAALARAQAQAQQQRQQQIIQQQQKQREEQARQSHKRSASHAPVDPHTEETIARVVNQIRQNSTMGGGDSMSPGPHSNLPHVVRTKKDEDDMDEDERLLNSEEGKKLSSKERRQLRNKVSARAFRSRRKEYISQLEGEVAAKTTEANELKMQNRALMEENARFRALAERLLRHPAFHPFLDELSRDPELAQSLSKMAGPSASPAPKDIDPYSSQAQQFMPPPQSENPHIGMALMPESQLDLASLSLGSNNWAVPSMGMPSFQQPQVFAVLELPEPAEPLNLDNLSGKGDDSFLDRLSSDDEKVKCPEFEAPIKVEEPVIEKPTKEPAATPTVDFDENDPTVTLFATPRPTTAPAASEPIAFENPLTEKPRFELVIIDETEHQRLNEKLERMMARMDASFNRIAAMTSRLDS